MSDTSVVITILNLIFTPVIVLLTMWAKAGFEKDKRRDNRDDKHFDELENRIMILEKRLDDKEKEIKEIRVELKNRDVEYIALYKQHTTLKAQYEVLSVDHEELKKLYGETAKELADLKDVLKHKAEKAEEGAKEIQNAL